LDDIKEDLRLMVVAREFPTASGPIDVLAVDADGVIYVIETKLYRNPDKRLVVAQMLDYGAALWRGYTDTSQFIADADAACVRTTGATLRQRLVDFVGIDEAHANEIIKAMQASLADGALRFVVLMDHLDARLKDLILFLNERADFDVYAVEMHFYRYKDFQIVIPTLHGAEVTKSVARAGSTSRRRRWDEQAFFQDAEAELTSSDVAAVRELHRFSAEAADRIDWGSGPSRGSFNPKFLSVCKRCPYTVWSDGDLTLNFGWFDRNDAERAARDHFGRQLQQIGLAQLPANWQTSYVSVSLDQWKSKLRDFTMVVRKVFTTGADS
jgi:hypothetical protein